MDIHSTDREKIRSFQCEPLRQELRKRGLNGNGNKDELVKLIVRSNEKRKKLGVPPSNRPQKKRKVIHPSKEAINTIKNTNSNSESDPACCLPKDIVVWILCFLDVKDVISCSLLNHTWNSVANTPALWKFLFARYYTLETIPQITEGENLINDVDWQKNFAETYFRSVVFNFKDEDAVRFWRIKSKRSTCNYCRGFLEDYTLGTYVDTGSMSYPCVHASCYLIYHKLSFFAKDKYLELTEHEMKEIARWMLQGKPCESTPPVLGPAQKWKKSFGPKKKPKK